MESSISLESVTMQTRLLGGSDRRPSSAAVYSMRLLVVCGSPPDSSTVPPPGATTIAAQPPGPGLPLHAPSVHTSDSPSRASTGISFGHRAAMVADQAAGASSGEKWPARAGR